MKAVLASVLLSGHWLEGESHQLHIQTLNPECVCVDMKGHFFLSAVFTDCLTPSISFYSLDGFSLTVAMTCHQEKIYNGPTSIL